MRKIFFKKTTLFVLLLCNSSCDLFAQIFANEKISPLPVGVSSYAAEFGSVVKFEKGRLVVSGPKLSANGAVIYFEFMQGKWKEKQQILPTGNSDQAQFGASLAIKGDLLVIGAPSTATSSSNDAIYIYRLVKDRWQLSQKISSLSLSSESFGSVVSTNGTEIAFSAKDCAIGNLEKDCVVILTMNGKTWIEEQFVVAEGIQSPLGFNDSILLTNDSLFVGAPRDRTIIYSLSGAVYEFYKSEGKWQQKQKIIGSKGFRYDEFGTAIDFSSGVLMVGAPGHDSAGENKGAVYAYTYLNDNWVESNKISLSPESKDLFFGFSVSILNNKVLIGRMSGSNTGTFSEKVYLFEKNNEVWSEIETFTNPQLGRFGAFGHSLVLTEDYIFVSEPFAQEGEWSGVVHEYNNSKVGWFYGKEIIPLDGSPNSNFGEEVTSNSGFLFVGSPLEIIGENKRGSVHIFSSSDSGYSFERKINGPKEYDYYQFGYDLDSTEKLLAVGSPSDEEFGQFGGAVHIYDRDVQWSQVQKINPGTFGEESRFGSSVALSPQFLAISAPFKKNKGVQSGAVYLYENINGEWLFDSMVSPAENNSDDYFGRNLKIDQSHLFIKSIYNDDISPGTGEVEIYHHDGVGWNYTQRFTDLNENYYSIGSEMHIEGNLAAISAITSEYNLGVIFLLGYNGFNWDYLQTIFPEEFSSSNQFGSSIFIKNEVVYTGSVNNNNFGYSSGAVHEFKKFSDNWIQTNKIFAGDLSGSIRFGASLTMMEGNLCTGAPLDSDRGLHSGAVYCVDLDSIFNDGFDSIQSSNKN